MTDIITFLLLFLTGSITGWLIEVIYRRYKGKARRWINPGFLSGPFLPLYGTGVCFLYIISDLDLAFEMKVVLFLLGTTGLEFLTGLFFLTYYHTRLWDYTSLRFHYKGIVSPLYSFYWLLLSLVFYALVYPVFDQQIDFLMSHLEYSLIIGVFTGFMLVDMSHSFNVVNRLRLIMKTVEGRTKAIQFEDLKMNIRDRFDDNIDGLLKRVKPSYLFPFKGNIHLVDRLQEHLEEINGKKPRFLKQFKPKSKAKK